MSGAATGYLYDGANIVQEQAGGAATASMLSGGVDEVFTRSDSSGSWNVLRDGLGSITDGLDWHFDLSCQ